MNVNVSRNVPARMRDGTILRADVYRLDGVLEPAPVALMRTCYDKTRPDDERVARALARAGYIAVVQDIRGRNASDGQWQWHMSHEGSVIESLDGYDTCEWAARLDGANGSVGVWGHSYPGWLAWRLAAAQPPALKALATSGISVRTTDCTHGVFEPGIRLRWHHRMAVDARRRVGDTGFPSTIEEAAYAWDSLLQGKWLWRVPMDGIPDDMFGPTAEMLRRYWHEISEDFWRLHEIHAAVSVPTLTITGWWDRLNSATDHYSGMIENGPVETRHLHRLLVGPWVHDVVAHGSIVGPRNTASAAIRYEDELVAWFDAHVRPPAERHRIQSGVQYMLLNETTWRQDQQWPPSTVHSYRLYLHSAGSANSATGDGTLSEDKPANERPDQYDYDPSDPVMSLQPSDMQMTACDQTPLATRRDILVYVSAPLAGDLVVAGKVCCELWVASDCPDTDFVVRLIEVSPTGSAINVCQGVLRARYRHGFDREVPLQRGQPELVTINLGNAGIRFQEGSRVRLDVTSSDFPNFDRNHNTGMPFSSDPELLVARQTVFHDPEHVSCLVLPVVGSDHEVAQDSHAGSEVYHP